MTADRLLMEVLREHAAAHPDVVYSPHFTGPDTFHCDPALPTGHRDGDREHYEIVCEINNTYLSPYPGILRPDGTREFLIGYSLQTYHHHFADGRCPSEAAAPAPLSPVVPSGGTVAGVIPVDFQLRRRAA